jgi:hypothetical protein
LGGGAGGGADRPSGRGLGEIDKGGGEGTVMGRSLESQRRPDWKQREELREGKRKVLRRGLGRGLGPGGGA